MQQLYGSETLVRDYLLPLRLIAAEGDAEHADLLLRAARKQVGLGVQESVHVRGKCRLVLDFGRELRGGLRIVLGRASGSTRVRLRLGESVGEALSEVGQKGSTNDHALRDLTLALPQLSDQQFFDSGFRFACVDFLEEATDLELLAVNAVSVRAPRPQVASFRCSDKEIERIFDTAARTVQLCAGEYIWDGIKRDRLVWVGDLYPEVTALLSLCADDGCVARSLDFVKEQTPLPGWMNGFPMYSMWWIILVEEYYRATGNADYLHAQRGYYEGLMRQIADCIGEDGSFDFGMEFVDWPTHGHADETEGVRSLCRLCAQSGMRLEALYGIRGGVAASVEQKLMRAGAEVTEKRQIAALKYLAGAALSERERAILTEGGAKGFSTFMSYFLLKALSDTAGEKAALSAMKEYYGGMLSMGATTFWEDFDTEWLRGRVCPVDRLPRAGEKDIHGDFGAFCYTGYRHSLCHGWSAGVVPFLFRRILGIRVEEAGFRKVTVSPRLGGLEYAEAELPVPQGVLRIECRREGGKTKVRVTAPAGTEVCVAEEDA